MQFDFGRYSPIQSDSEDEEDKEQREDLLTNLMNVDISKVAPAPSSQPVQPVQSEKTQQYQGYYAGYNYPPQQQQRPPHMQGDNRWGNYPQMGQQQPQNLYSPLNPMAGKYSGSSGPTPASNPMSQGQVSQAQMGQQGGYKNPMAAQRNPQMSGGYFDRRYQGYQQQ